MRQTINILWLEDDSAAYEDYMEIIEDVLEDMGYKGEIKPFNTFEQAYKELDSLKRYDFFISDFNLENDKTGLTYLEEIRSRNGFKQFVILYSNNEYSKIKEDVIQVVKDKNLDVFSNFTFFSVGDNREEINFKKAVDVILCRWDELNAIRGRYMFENARLEHLLRCKLGKTKTNREYKNLVRDYFGRLRFDNNKKNSRNRLKNDWLAMVDKRNMLAHSEEKYDSKKGYYIYSKDDYSDEELYIYEDSLKDERKQLVNLLDEIILMMDREILQPERK